MDELVLGRDSSSQIPLMLRYFSQASSLARLEQKGGHDDEKERQDKGQKDCCSSRANSQTIFVPSVQQKKSKKGNSFEQMSRVEREREGTVHLR